jgi:hypothetical protein
MEGNMAVAMMLQRFCHCQRQAIPFRGSLFSSLFKDYPVFKRYISGHAFDSLSELPFRGGSTEARSSSGFSRRSRYMSLSKIREEASSIMISPAVACARCARLLKPERAIRDDDRRPSAPTQHDTRHAKPPAARSHPK